MRRTTRADARIATECYVPGMRSVGLAILLASLAMLVAARADEAAIRTYEVTGETYRELLASMRRNGPMAARTGRRHFGVTEVEFRQSFDYQEAGSRCELLGARIDLVMTIVLPEWTDRANASHTTVRRWERLREDIVAHEERHAEIAREYLEKLRAELDRPVSAISCAALEAGIKARSQIVLDQHRRSQLAFDGIDPDES